MPWKVSNPVTSLAPALTLALHEVAAIVLIGGERVMSFAAQGEISCAVRAPARVRGQMMQLEKRGFSAAKSPLIDIGALRAIS